MLLTYLIDVLVVLWRRDREQQQRSPFISMPRYFQRNPIGRLIEGIHVINELVVAHVPFAYLKTDNRLRCRDGRIKFYTVGQVIIKIQLWLCKQAQRHCQDEKGEKFSHGV